MPVKEVFAVSAALLAILGYVPYLRGMFKDIVQPHPYTWLVSTLVSGIILAGQIMEGAGVGSIPTATSLLFTGLIFLYSLRFGLRHITTLDSIFLASALFAIVPWLLTKDPTLSVLGAVLIDLIALAPTIRKTWVSPRTESIGLYGANVLRHFLTLFSLEAYTLVTSAHSAVMLASNIGMTLLIALRRRTVSSVDTSV